MVGVATDVRAVVFVVGLYGHSAVYDAETREVLVFGGYVFTRPSLTPSSSLYALNLDSLQWRLLQLDRAVSPHVCVGAHSLPTLQRCASWSGGGCVQFLVCVCVCVGVIICHHAHWASWQEM